MSNGSGKGLHEDDGKLSSDPSLGEDGLIDPLIAKLNLFDPSSVNLKFDPVAMKIRKARGRKASDALERLIGLPTESQKSNTESSGESVADVTVADGVVSIRFKNPSLADEWGNEIRNFLKHRLP